MEKTAESRDDKRVVLQKMGFESFMKNSTNRLLMSMIPPGEKPEILEVMLRSAYNAGWGGGEAMTLVEVMQQLRSEKKETR